MARTQVGAQTKTADIPRSSFDLSHGLKTTFNASDLVPILSLEVLPGDTINLRASLFGRMSTPVKPVLDNLFLETFFFYTPWRQVWPSFTKMMGEQDAPGDSIDYSVPKIVSVTPTSELDLYDYMGIPPGTQGSNTPFSALPFRCYNKIFNFWFRDENLVDPVVEPIVDADATSLATFQIKQRRKRRDYITSCLPFPQKGPDTFVNLGGDAPIKGIGYRDSTQQVGSAGVTMRETGDVSRTVDFASNLDTYPAYIEVDGATIGDRFPQIYADLQNATGISINDLRESIQIQRLLERDARGGTRYPEILRSHFQVSDPGLLVHQRPLFLGGGSSRININPVQQTYPTVEAGDATPQGNLAAYGTVSGSNHGFTASFTEHGHILGLVNVRADLTYQQGIERYFNRTTRFDFYWPALSHLGEQEVKNVEVMVSNDPTIDQGTFGYMPRYDEYRFKQSQITGLFRSEASASLDVWHLAQDFATLPVLGESFITDNVPMDRILAVPSEPDFLLDVWFRIKAARPLPMYGTPGLMDHF